VSYITNQWVKMNPFEAANRLTELERENAALRAAYSKLETDLMDEVVNAEWAQELERENAALRAAIDAARKEKP